MDNRHYDNPFDDYPNVLSANVVNATTNEVIIVQYIYTLFNNQIVNYYKHININYLQAYVYVWNLKRLMLVRSMKTIKKQ